MKKTLPKYYPLIPVFAAYLIMFVIGFSMPGMWQMVALLAFYCALGQSWNIFMGMTGYVDFGYVTFIALGTYGMSLGITYFSQYEWLGIGIITSLLGPNGVGKPTFLLTVLGSVEPWGGKIFYENEEITHLPTHKKVDLGITLVPEGKHLFGGMTVHENLIMGAYRKEAIKNIHVSLELVYSLFPILKERDKQKAVTLSGGQQQMVTIARALMTKPKLIMLDEPSQGLAPILVGEVFETIGKLQGEVGLTILLVEQNAEASLNAANYVYIMHEGQIKSEGTSEEIKGSSEIREAYLGI